MNFRILSIAFLFLLTSCSTYKIAKHVTDRKFNKSGLEYKQVELGNYTITYWDSENDKPVLILLHGFGASTQFQWFNQVQALRKDYRLILPNLIYFGGSDSKMPVSSVGEQVQAVQALIDKLQVKRFSLCGVSYGGLVSAELALKNKERVQKMVLCDAPVKFMEQKDLQEVCDKYHVCCVDQLLVPDDYRKLKPLMGIAYAHPPNPPLFMFKSFYNNMYIKQAEGKKRLLNGLESEKDIYASRVYDFTFPVLLIWGAEDKLIPLKVGQELQKHIGGSAKLEVIPNTAHMPSLEDPEVFNKILVGFLKE